MDRRAKVHEASGIPVDSTGGPTVDPTKNVLDLVEASIKRIDDMAVLTGLLVEARLKVVEETAKLRAEHNAEIDRLRAEHQSVQDDKESRRLDSVRQVDQMAVRNESDRSALAITALASSAAVTAETLRSAVNTSAANLATQLDRTVSAITERIASLEKSSYQGIGRAGVADPAADRLQALVEALARAQSQGTGKSEGISSSWVVLVGVAGLILTLLGIGGAILALMPRSTAVPVVSTPIGGAR